MGQYGGEANGRSEVVHRVVVRSMGRSDDAKQLTKRAHVQHAARLSSLGNSRLSSSSRPRLTSPSSWAILVSVRISKVDVLNRYLLNGIDLDLKVISVDLLAELSFDELRVKGPRRGRGR